AVAEGIQQLTLIVGRGRCLAVDGQTALVETHLQAISEADEGITRQPLAAHDALEQKARAKRLELEIRRDGRIQVSCNVEWRFQSKLLVLDLSFQAGERR